MVGPLSVSVTAAPSRKAPLLARAPVHRRCCGTPFRQPRQQLVRDVGAVAVALPQLRSDTDTACWAGDVSEAGNVSRGCYRF